MLDKYRHLLFEESTRLGPSAEMVMMDRMFIQEEKISLGQDRILARDRPEEYVANSKMLERESGAASMSQSQPQSFVSAEPSAVWSSVATAGADKAPTPIAASTPAHFPSTKLVIKQGGAGASVSWSSSPAPVARSGVRQTADTQSHSSSFSHGPPPPSSPISSYRPFSSNSSYRPSSRPDDDDDGDSLPQRTSKPPMKTYAARPRIGLKLKIKQEAGFSKVVHNTALDLVHTPSTPSQPHPTTQPQPQPHPTTQPQPQPHPTTQPQPQPHLTTQPHPQPHPTTQPQPQPHPTTQPQPALTHPKARAVAALATSPSITTVIRTPPPTCNATSSATVSIATAQATPSPQRVTAPQPPSSSTYHPWSSSSTTTPSSSSFTAQMNGTLEHHIVGGVERNPASTVTPPQTTCRLPLRKTYRENISPRVRPGVPGGGGDSVPYPRPSPSPPKSPLPPPSSSPSALSERTVIANVKLEKRGGSSMEVGSHPHTEPSRETPRLGNSSSSSPGLVQGLEHMEVLYRGIKNTKTPPHLSDRSRDSEREDGDRGADMGRYKRVSSKNHQRSGSGTFRMDQHAPGPPSSPPDASCYRDSLPAKRCKSDSPDMDNASFSSGSPPHDESLNEHLQCAIDSILNLQGQVQGPTPRGAKGGAARPHHSQRTTGPQSSNTHRPSVSSSSSSSSSSQVGGRGHNGGLVPQTHGR
uniref:GLTSCR protein conserved domain-containing protein n=1 Tax=Hucho hucho TaxID=62062 RepID=A0A4W5KK22_9TELE